MIEHQRIRGGEDELDTCAACGWASWDTSVSFDNHATAEGWVSYAAEQERHAETARALERLRDGVARLHDMYAVAPNEPRCCPDCAANDFSGELRLLLRDAE